MAAATLTETLGSALRMENVYLESITDTHGVAKMIRDATRDRVNVVMPLDTDDPGATFRKHIADSSLCVIVIGDDWNRSKFWITTVLPEIQKRSIATLAVNPAFDLTRNGYRKMFSDYGVPVIDGNIDYIAGYLIGRNKSLEYQAPEEVIAQDQFKISVATLTETIDFALRRNPEAIHQLSPRQFEEFIAELMEKSGYEVTLTRASRDNGVDIYAVKADSFGRFLTVVDCKKYRADRTIGIEVVRGMMAVLHIENASHAMLATTSSFSSVARNFEREHRFAISLKDHADILDWSTGHNRT